MYTFSRLTIANPIATIQHSIAFYNTAILSKLRVSPLPVISRLITDESASQIKVTGSGTGTPSDSDLVSIPALYEGATFPNIYNDDSSGFVVPGPAPVTFGQAGTDPSPNPPQAPAATSGTSTVIASSPTQTQSPTPMPTPAPSNQCSLGSRKLFRRRSLEKRHRVA